MSAASRFAWRRSISGWKPIFAMRVRKDLGPAALPKPARKAELTTSLKDVLRSRATSWSWAARSSSMVSVVRMASG
jgi:hypothetical protein